jgi:enoyl-CoA hydratase/carnithine racemase
MSEKSPLAVEQEGSIAWLILNRPEKRNAMAMDFFDELRRHFAALDKDFKARGHPSARH